MIIRKYMLTGFNATCDRCTRKREHVKKVILKIYKNSLYPLECKIQSVLTLPPSARAVSHSSLYWGRWARALTCAWGGALWAPPEWASEPREESPAEPPAGRPSAHSVLPPVALAMVHPTIPVVDPEITIFIAFFTHNSSNLIANNCLLLMLKKNVRWDGKMMIGVNYVNWNKRKVVTLHFRNKKKWIVKSFFIGSSVSYEFSFI